jgi:hypothetical protein
LVSIAAGAEGDSQDDVRDEEMQYTADGEPGARCILEGVAVRRPVGDAVHRFVDHDPVYPLFDGRETVRVPGVDEFATGDNRGL